MHVVLLQALHGCVDIVNGDNLRTQASSATLLQQIDAMEFSAACYIK